MLAVSVAEKCILQIWLVGGAKYVHFEFVGSVFKNTKVNLEVADLNVVNVNLDILNYRSLRIIKGMNIFISFLQQIMLLENLGDITIVFLFWIMEELSNEIKFINQYYELYNQRA